MYRKSKSGQRAAQNIISNAKRVKRKCPSEGPVDPKKGRERAGGVSEGKEITT